MTPDTWVAVLVAFVLVTGFVGIYVLGVITGRSMRDIELHKSQSQYRQSLD